MGGGQAAGAGWRQGWWSKWGRVVERMGVKSGGLVSHCMECWGVDCGVLGVVSSEGSVSSW